MTDELKIRWIHTQSLNPRVFDTLGGNYKIELRMPHPNSGYKNSTVDWLFLNLIKTM